LQIKEKKITGVAVQRKRKERIANGEALFSISDLIPVLQFHYLAKFLLILSSINTLILTPFPFGPRSIKELQIGLQLIFNL
jgi:hypothetical protein